MISKDKTYRTRDGREVRIYATDGGAGTPIMGAILFSTEGGNTWWESARWREDGSYDPHGRVTIHDLIEVCPRIKRTVWINVYEHCITAYETPIPQGVNLPLCRVKVEIDCEKGEGL